MKLVILDGYPSNPGDVSWAELEQYGDLTVYDRTPANQVAERIGDAEIVLLNKTPITAEIFGQCPKLKLICVLATGYNIVDVAAAKAHGVTVCNVPGYSTGAVAQMTFALLLELTQQVGLHSQAVFAGTWQHNPDFCFWQKPLMELQGKVLGLVGYGAIGKAVAAIGQAFGMKVIATKRHLADSDAPIPLLPLNDLLSQADVVSLHCPQTADNLHLINETTLALMKDGAILLNTARGGLVDEQAVAIALKQGKLRGYGADVVSREPILAENPLLTAPNCFLTPHIAWAPKETRERLHGITAANIAAFLQGNPQNVV